MRRFHGDWAAAAIVRTICKNVRSYHVQRVKPKKDQEGSGSDAEHEEMDTE